MFHFELTNRSLGSIIRTDKAERSELMESFPCISGLPLRRRSLLRGYKTLYLEACSETDRLLWIEEENSRGKAAYPCVYECSEGVFVYYPNAPERNVGILSRWRELTHEKLLERYALSEMGKKQFAAVYKDYRDRGDEKVLAEVDRNT